jgi:MSHA biogenesis protein MshJ
MKQQWRKFVEFVDNMSLRERALIFGTAALLLVALMDVVLISSESDRKQRLSAEISQRQTEMASIQEQLQKMVGARQSDPDRQMRARLESLKTEMTAVDAAIAEEQRRFTAPGQMRVVLEGMLDRNHGVRLVEFKTLPPAAIGDVRTQAQQAANPAAAKPAVNPAAAGAEPTVYRHEVEITVAGGYLELLKYLADLEKLPTQLYWGQAEMSVLAYPALTLKLTVYTMSVGSAWMGT